MTSERSETTGEDMRQAQCPMCPAGTLREGTTTLTMERGEATIVFKEVPADVCDSCGEAFVDGDVSEEVYQQAKAAVEAGVQVDVRRYGSRPKPTA